jgi:hypothetical protein
LNCPAIQRARTGESWLSSRTFTRRERGGRFVCSRT